MLISLVIRRILVFASEQRQMVYEIAMSADAQTHLAFAQQLLSQGSNALLADKATSCWAALDYAPPCKTIEVGILLWDDVRKHMALLLRSDWRGIVDPQDLEYFEGFMDMVSRMNVEEVLETIRFFEDSLSNILRMRAPETSSCQHHELRR